MKEEKICVICGEEYEGWGNNAQPLEEGRCCDICNHKVIIARLNRFEKTRKNRKRGGEK